MKVAIVGSRGFDNYDRLKKILDQLDIDVIISGGARGADSLGEQYALERGIDTLIFEPDWDKYGNRAGYIRNTDIINNADIVFAFWDGESKGTLHSINLAKKKRKGLRIIRYKEKK